MGRGLVLSFQTRAIDMVLLSLQKWKVPTIFPRNLNQCRRTFCISSAATQEQTVDIAEYKKAFSRRMAMAGLRPHNRIALGVSGGPDSMALCVLAANWKTEGLNGVVKKDGFIDGLLAIIVDHGLRAESKDEAILVRNRVSEMAIRCEIACCDWPEGKPKPGHLQEAARDMRYQKFHDLCMRNQISVLLIAHHADDQAELFILRASRGSGVLGLAGMAFTSQVFSSYVHLYKGDLKDHSILLVRPLLDFSKGDLYKICQGVQQEWVEDPTNRNQLFARNRIRMSLGGLSSCVFKSEIMAVISACRKTRAYVDRVCHNLINQAVTITDDGYAVIDLATLNASKVEDICLSRFLALVLQFISQRQRPIRGSTSKLLLDYIRTTPCKNSLTAAGCYLSPAPGSKGAKALVCSSVDCPLPSKSELRTDYNQEKFNSSELEQIIENGQSYSDNLVPDASKVPFLNLGSASVLDEARRLMILSESTYRDILSLQSEETRQFRSKKSDVNFESETRHEAELVRASLSERLEIGHTCYFMNRFIVAWNLDKKNVCSCVIGGDNDVVEVRPMIEGDWLYLAELSSKWQVAEKKNTSSCLDFSMLSAKRGLKSLKSIPSAARKSLPVLVNSNGVLLSVPCIGFKQCPRLMVYAVFKPRVPVGGGHSSFI